MATKVVPGGLWLPSPFYSVGTGIPALDSFLLDAATEKFAHIFRVPRSGVLNRVGFRTGAVANNPDNGLRISFQDLNASGNPDGTQDQFRDVAGPFSANTWYTTGLLTDTGADGGTKRTVVAGDRIAVVIEFVSFVAADSITISATQAVLNDGTAFVAMEHYVDLFTAAWVKSRGAPLLALEYETDGYLPLADSTYPVLAYTNISPTLGGNPDEAALRFQLPFAARCDGAWVRAQFTGDCEIRLYDSDGTTVLASTVIDASAGLAATGLQIFARWAPVVLSANTTYRLSVRPTVAGATVYGFTVDSAAIMDAAVGGIEWYKSLHTFGGGWAETATERPLIGLHLSALEEGSTGATAMVSIQSPAIVYPMGVVGY